MVGGWVGVTDKKLEVSFMMTVLDNQDANLSSVR